MQLRWFFTLLTSFYCSLLLAGEDDLYDFLWLDPDKSVYVLQNKIYPKDKSLYLDLGYLMNATSTFQDTSGAQFKIGYFFSEEFAIEFNHITYSNLDNAALDSVKVVAGLSPFVRRPLSSTSLFIIWSPFYGKINTFNRIYYFDLSFGIGTGRYKMESNLKTAQLTSIDLFESEAYTPLQLKTSLKFHLNKSLHIGLEVLNTNFESSAPKTPNKKSWDQNYDAIFGIGVSF